MMSSDQLQKEELSLCLATVKEKPGDCLIFMTLDVVEFSSERVFLSMSWLLLFSGPRDHL